MSAAWETLWQRKAGRHSAIDTRATEDNINVVACYVKPRDDTAASFDWDSTQTLSRRPTTQRTQTFQYCYSSSNKNYYALLSHQTLSSKFRVHATTTRLYVFVKIVFFALSVESIRGGELSYSAAGKCPEYVKMHTGKCPYGELSVLRHYIRLGFWRAKTCFSIGLNRRKLGFSHRIVKHAHVKCVPSYIISKAKFITHNTIATFCTLTVNKLYKNWKSVLFCILWYQVNTIRPTSAWNVGSWYHQHRLSC